MHEVETIAVIGAGTMGSGIAHVFARSGFRVLLCDVEQRFLDRALASIPICRASRLERHIRLRREMFPVNPSCAARPWLPNGRPQRARFGKAPRTASAQNRATRDADTS